MSQPELIEADISFCTKYIRYLSKLPLEAVLIQNFKLSFQIGDNSKKLDEAIARMLLKKDKYTKADIFTVVSKDRYYKCIYTINNLVEVAIMKALIDVDIEGVEFKNMKVGDGKLIAVFEVFR